MPSSLFTERYPLTNRTEHKLCESPLLLLLQPASHSPFATSSFSCPYSYLNGSVTIFPNLILNPCYTHLSQFITLFSANIILLFKRLTFIYAFLIMWKCTIRHKKINLLQVQPGSPPALLG